MKRMMLTALLFLMVLLAGTAVPAGAAAPPLAIEDYSRTVDFTGKKLVLIMKGDDPSYADPAHNDSGWTLISLPSDWSDYYPDWTGVCWYRLRLRFPERQPVHSVGIQLGVVSDVDELYLNGKLIAATGKFPPERKSSYDRIRIYEIPTSLVRAGAENLLALRVAGFFRETNGPYTGTFLVGPFMQLQRDLLSREFFNVFFVVIYLAVSVYFGFIFFRHSVEKENLFFSLATLLSAVYFFMRTQIKFFVPADFLLLKKIEYVTLFLIFAMFMEFITHYSGRRRTALHWVFYTVTAAGVLATAISNNPVFWHNVLNWMVQPSWLIPVGYSVCVIISDFRKRFDSIYLMVAFAALLVTMVNDILVHRNVYQFIRLSGYAYMLMILGIAIIMHNRVMQLVRRFEGLEDGALAARKAEKDRRRGTLTPEAEEKLKEALAVIGRDFAAEISRESLAEDLGMNPDYLGKLFKQYTGKKISEYLSEVRVKKAVELLRDGDNSIPNIAFAVGFESLPTFYRVFQKCTGHSPMAYRKKISSSDGGGAG
ncbi:MAG: helix-turn-helix domain-containing protein [Spirochaetes bacterium]|nr:helix-turn-helix domain-containing protein [Spirochaetota bacterium]